ncbi:MAG TPA: ERF family protein [Allocoleopsis sp.]
MMFKTSDQTGELDKALSKFNSEMPAIERSQSVKMKGIAKNSGKEYEVNYEYAPLELLQEQAKPVLSKHGLTINQFLSCEKIIENGFEKLQTGIVTRIGHESGQSIVSFWPIDLNGITKEQDRGSKITYNKRYAWAAALNISLINEDDDAVLLSQSQIKNQEPKKQAQETKHDVPKTPLTNAGKVINYGKSLGYDEFSIKLLSTEWNGTPVDLNSLNNDQCRSLCEYMKAKKES